MIRAELNQSRLRGGQRFPNALLARVLREAGKTLGINGERRISIAFVSPRHIRELNRIYRGKDCVTDVLSFPLGDDEMFGEVLICYEQAVRQAREQGHATRDEIVFLLVHGILHLFGFDHETPEDAQEMFPLQTEILERLGVDSRI